jgi:FkbM family methyltransferase
MSLAHDLWDDTRMRPTRRAVGAVSRRLGRPELLAAFYPGARQALHEEIGLRAILASALRRDATYVDVGANRGQTLRDAVRVAPEGRHVAFEPIPAVAAELSRMFPTVDCREMALGARPGDAQFCYFRDLDGWSGLRRSPRISDERGNPEYIKVTISTLDAEIADRIPRVIKIDVEGAELGVVEGARALLAEARPLVIFEHVAAASALYGTPPEALWELLTGLGYEIFAVTGDGPFTREAFVENTAVVNWLATPNAGPDGR